MTEIANVNTITSLFLYGTLEPPKDVEARLRSSDSPQSIDVKVDIFSYMSGPGRYASLYQTDVVKSFFAGDLPSEIFRVNESGEREITFGELRDANLASRHSGSVSISQYSTDMLSADFIDRAYIWGSTSFVLNDEATFVVGENGSFIRSGTMLPYDTDFDLDSLSLLATAYNEGALRNALDPYGIGRTVNLFFSDEDKHLWKVAHVDDVATSVDNPGVIADVISGAVYYANVDPIKGGIAGADLLGHVWDAARYIEDGHNIIYGSNSDDQLTALSLKGYGVSAFLPSIYVGGEGNDNITTSGLSDEIVFAGSGDDTILAMGTRATIHAGSGDDYVTSSSQEHEIYAGSGDDIIFISGHSSVYGDAGDDTIYLNGGANAVRGDEGDDTFVFSPTQGPSDAPDHITDASPNDHIRLGSDILTGGEARLGQLYGEKYYQREGYNLLHFIAHSEEAAIYDVREDKLHIEFKGGHQVVVDDYTIGDGGIDAKGMMMVMAPDIRPFVADLYGATFSGVEVMDEFGSSIFMDVYNGLQSYTIAQIPVPH